MTIYEDRYPYRQFKFKLKRRNTLMGIRKATAQDAIYTVIVMLVAVGTINLLASTAKRQVFRPPVYAATAIATTPSPSLSPTPTPTPEPTVIPPSTPLNREIRAEIDRVFTGVHNAKAYRLLACENRELKHGVTNVNDNGSVDFGLFQLNSYWYGFNKYVNNARFLADWRINTAIAWRIYEDDGYTFKQWTCGKKLGI